LKTVAFFSAKSGVGETTLVYHLAWMFQELGVRTVALDLDPQASLTASFVLREELERHWASGDESSTVYNFVKPLLNGAGEEPNLQALEIASHLALVPGELALGQLEDRLAENWTRYLDDEPAALKGTSVFSRLAASSGRSRSADLVLMDLGPSLGALNRAALLAADHLVMPLATSFNSIQALRSVGPILSRWRKEWEHRRPSGSRELFLPAGQMQSTGYVLLRHTAREDRWADLISPVYHHEILGEPEGAPLPDPDPHRLASLKHYRSLMPLAQDARKPLFSLRAADGAIGSQAQAVQDCHRDFETLARRIAARVGVSIPSEERS
jgi:cellulose biosynthesis protein BcsQ